MQRALRVELAAELGDPPAVVDVVRVDRHQDERRLDLRLADPPLSEADERIRAVERVVGGRSPDRRDIGEAVVADGGVAIRGPRANVDGDRTGCSQIRQPGDDLPESVDIADDNVVAATPSELWGFIPDRLRFGQLREGSEQRPESAEAHYRLALAEADALLEGRSWRDRKSVV